MRADILDDGMLRLTPITATEETMLNIWFVGTHATKQVKEVVMVDSFESVGPACIKSIEETAGKVENLTAGAKKELRKVVKEELDQLKVQYNGRASTGVLQAILEKIKLQRASNKVEKEPTKTEPPEPPAQEPEKKKRGRPPKEKAPKPDLEGELVTGPEPTIDTVRETLKKFAATKGRTEAIKLLADHDATMISELKEEKYAEFLIAADVDNG